MSHLKELKSRINSVKSTQKITQAMKLVSAAKLHKAQLQLAQVKEYHTEFVKAVAQLTANVEDIKLPMLQGKSNILNHLFIIIGSERGLCGGFNNNINKYLNQYIEQNEISQYNILCIGNKLRNILIQKHRDYIIEIFEDSFAHGINYPDVKDVSDHLLHKFAANEFGSCSIIYNEFHSVLAQKVVGKSLIPTNLVKSNHNSSNHYRFEPKQEIMLEELLKRYFMGEIYRALLENSTSEHGARMVAMDNAVRNAEGLIKSLTLQYNRTRQATITEELIEIISGAEGI